MTTTTEGRWNALADRDGFIVVYPDALDNFWNDCRAGDGGTQADDVAFIQALIAHRSASHPIDQRRIYAAGHSNGGMMAMRLALELPLAAIDANTSALPVDSECSMSTRPLAVMFLAGTADPVVPFDGGKVNLPGMPSDAVLLSAEATVDFWVTARGLSTSPRLTPIPDQVPEDGSTLTLHVYSGGTGSGEVRYYRADGGGHGWPAPTQFPLAQQQINGLKNQDIVGCDEAWSFFQQHTLPDLPSSQRAYLPLVIS